jgi:DNA-binding response OmpR family regulator
MSTPPAVARSALRKVLVVDDDEDIGVIAKLALSLDGTVAVEVCMNGADALVQAARFQPDVVLLDVMMPGLDGPATLARLRENAALKDLPVVFLTAKALPAEIDRLLALGAIAVIPKPFAPMTLLSRLRTIWQGAGATTDTLGTLAMPAGRFSKRMARDAVEFSALLQSLTEAAGPGRQEALLAIDRLAHKLHGAAATFGAAEVASAVLDLRAALRSALASGNRETGGVLNSLRILISVLSRVRC